MHASFSSALTFFLITPTLSHPVASLNLGKRTGEMGILSLPLIGPLLTLAPVTDSIFSQTVCVLYRRDHKEVSSFMISSLKGSLQGLIQATSLLLAWLASGSGPEQTYSWNLGERSEEISTTTLRLNLPWPHPQIRSDLEVDVRAYGALPRSELHLSSGTSQPLLSSLLIPLMQLSPALCGSPGICGFLGGATSGNKTAELPTLPLVPSTLFFYSAVSSGSLPICLLPFCYSKPGSHPLLGEPALTTHLQL